MIPYAQTVVVWMALLASAGAVGLFLRLGHPFGVSLALVQASGICAVLSLALAGGLREVVLWVQVGADNDVLVNGFHPLLPGLAAAALAAYLLSPACFGNRIEPHGRRRIGVNLVLAAGLVGALAAVPGDLSYLVHRILYAGTPVAPLQPEVRFTLDVCMVVAILHVLAHRRFRFVCLAGPEAPTYDRRCAHFHAILFATVTLLAVAGLPVLGLPLFLVGLVLPAAFASRWSAPFSRQLFAAGLFGAAGALGGLAVVLLTGWAPGPATIVAMGALFLLGRHCACPACAPVAHEEGAP